MTITTVLLIALCLFLSVMGNGNTYIRLLSTGVTVVCDRCPPGTHLRAHCTDTRRTQCRPCSAGFYTEFWNYIPECLPCDLCAINQEETQACTSSQNRSCQCKEGYYWLSHYCKKHTVCPDGHGIKSKGTPTQDTQCEKCVKDHYAAGAVGSKVCTPHTPCDLDKRLVLKGTSWHDNVCVTCDKITTQGWSEIIRPLLPELFAQQKLSRRLQRFISHLQPLVNGSSFEVLQEWLSGASEKQLTELPAALIKARLQKLADKVEHKVKRLQEEAKYCSNSIM